MLFHTWLFFAFFAAVYVFYLPSRGTRAMVPLLLAASYVFYGWLSPLYPVLVAYVSLVDWLVVTAMARRRRTKAWLALSIANDLALLGSFKYAAFLAGTLDAAFEALALPLTVPVPSILFPAGLSFFIFQSLTYTIDFYRGKVEREPNLLRYAAFVALFPQLLSGPIERARNLLPQLRGRPEISRADIAAGLSLFVTGLFKKVALADYLALYVDRVYGAPAAHAAPALLLATFAFAWQIYFDFSGYTDMARGIARIMGFRLMLNFENPYLATSLRDFWGRWHISLSTWFRDYVYIPLGGNRGSAAATYRNMALTMLISGLWHGANWTFVAWGAIHAAGRTATRRLEETIWYRDRVPAPAKQLWVFAFVTFAWIFFKARSFADAWAVLGGIASLEWADPGFPLLAAFLIGAVWAYQAIAESRLRWVVECAPVQIGLAVAMIFYLVVCAGSSEQAFIYFQF